MDQISNFIKKYREIVVSVAATITTTIALVVYLSSFFEFGNKWLFPYIRDRFQILWLISLTLFVSLLWIWISRLRQRFTTGFKDDFRGDLRSKWDFEGPWRIAGERKLLVTGSDAGGITKVGSQWENYTFEFEAQILEDCLGVIVRAQDLTNYYMFQIWPDKIRPHRRAAVPVIGEEKRITPDKRTTEIPPYGPSPAPDNEEEKEDIPEEKS